MVKKAFTTLMMSILALSFASLNVGAQEAEWIQKNPANSPSNRAVHAMAYDSQRHKVVIFWGT